MDFRPFVIDFWCLLSWGLVMEWNNPSVSEIDSMSTAGAILAPYNLRDTNIGNGEVPVESCSGYKRVENTGLGSTKTHYRRCGNAKSTAFYCGQFSYMDS